MPVYPLFTCSLVQRKTTKTWCGWSHKRNLWFFARWTRALLQRLYSARFRVCPWPLGGAGEKGGTPEEKLLRPCLQSISTFRPQAMLASSAPSSTIGTTRRFMWRRSQTGSPLSYPLSSTLRSWYAPKRAEAPRNSRARQPRFRTFRLEKETFAENCRFRFTWYFPDFFLALQSALIISK